MCVAPQQSMPKKECPNWIKDCWEVHSGSVSESNVAVDWADLKAEWRRCWCCGHETDRLQKCHIVPKSLGGSNSASNIIPMCALCHDGSPDVNSATEMFEWIKKRQNPLSGIGLGRYWHIYDLVEKHMKSMQDFDDNCFNKCLLRAYANASFHGSQAGAGVFMKRSTREWIVDNAFSAYSKGDKK